MGTDTGNWVLWGLVSVRCVEYGPCEWVRERDGENGINKM